MMKKANIDLYANVPRPWKTYFDKNELGEVSDFLATRNVGCWQPSAKQIFLPLELSADPCKVKVCLVGQDPYPKRVQPTGLPFSVNGTVPIDHIPGSLSIIFWELVRDLRSLRPRQACPPNGCLRPWTEFCLLWNAAPTCQVGQSGSHLRAWRQVTQRLLRRIAEQCEGVVFIAWGAKARGVVPKNLPPGRLIYSYSPSPFTAYRSPYPFVGSRPFTRAAAASPRGLKPSDWRL